MICARLAVNARLYPLYAPLLGAVGNVAEVVFVVPARNVGAAPPAGENTTAPETSQSPAVNEMEVTFAAVLVVNETAEPLVISLSMYSPTLPAATFPPDVMPTMLGVVSVGDVPKTAAPEPVSSVRAAARLALEGVPRKVATLVPSPLTPLEIGRPVQLVRVPDDGVPRAGVVRVGEVAKTAAPVPVSSVNADRRFALDGVARNVATPVPSPLTPVEIGSPVAFVNVPDDGVPNAPPLMTIEPADPTFTPSAVRTPVPEPDMPVESGRPVQLVSVPEAGVPRTGAVRVRTVPSVVAPEMPANKPALLYWTCVFDPAGVPVGVPQVSSPRQNVSELAPVPLFN